MLPWMAIPPVCLLVIRAWVEEGSERPLRVEVRLTADTAHGFQRELTFSEPVAVEALVRAWLDDVLAADGDRPAGAAPGKSHTTVTPRSWRRWMISGRSRGRRLAGRSGRDRPSTVAAPLRRMAGPV